MKIASVRIQNLRAIRDQTVEFDDYTCLVGPNGCGKSTILTALNIFFRETANAATDMVNLDVEDFHQRQTGEPIVITVTFADLSPEAQQDFKDYCRQGKLVVSAKAIWNDQQRIGEVKQHGERLGIDRFREFFEQDKAGAAVGELKQIYQRIKDEFPDLAPPTTKARMLEGLRDYEAAHPEQESLLSSEDEFYGVSRGANRLQKYLQWVFIPAVKDAATEQLEAKNTALGKLLARTVRATVSLQAPIDALQQETRDKYAALLGENQQALESLSESLRKRLQAWAHEDAGLNLKWQSGDKAVSVAQPIAELIAREGVFEGRIVRFGHGLQRSFIFALLQELSGCTQEGPKLILGCEEPELYQHPPQIRHLASLLQELSTQNSQVIVCTHSPYLVDGKNFEQVRVVKRNSGQPSCEVHQATFETVAAIIAHAKKEVAPRKVGGIAAKVAQDMLGPANEMFFASLPILAEGAEDVAYISTYLTLLNKWAEFRRLGCHLVPVGGKNNLIQPIAVCQALSLPFFVLFDADGHERDAHEKANHEKVNRAILNLCSWAGADSFPGTTFWGDNVAVWPTDIGEVVASEIGKDSWQGLQAKVRTDYQIDTPGMNKNSLFIAYTLTEAWNEGLKSPSLEHLSEAILRHAVPNQGRTERAAHQLVG